MRWSDDKRKDRKASSNDRKRSDSSLDDQAATTSRDQATKDVINDLTSGVGQLRVGEKSRGKKSEASYSSPRTKKKSTSKTKKHPGSEDVIDDSLRLSQESQLNRSASGRQSSANGRRNASSDIQLSEIPAKHSAKATKGKDGRKGTCGRDDGLEVTRSGDECSRSSPISGRHSVRTTRFDSEENGENKYFMGEKLLILGCSNLLYLYCLRILFLLPCLVSYAWVGEYFVPVFCFVIIVHHFLHRLSYVL